MAKVTRQGLWARRIAACERSGLSRRAWCTANGVAVNTFGYWSRKLQTAPSGWARTRRRGLVPIVVEGSVGRSGQTAGVATIEITLPGGVVLRAAPTLEVEWLAKLVRELRAC